MHEGLVPEVDHNFYYTNDVYCTYTLDTEQEVWPENVELYEPCKGNLIFLVAFVLVTTNLLHAYNMPNFPRLSRSLDP